MAERPMRRIGVVTALLGLLVTLVAVVASAAPAAAADNEGLICNNQQNRPDKDCEGDKNHGTITSSFDTEGNLVFELTAAADFPGWRQIYICVGTGDTPTNGADCQGSTQTVLHPNDAGGDEYDVTDVDPDSAITEDTNDVSFAECATGITAVVKADALPPGGFNWIVHVNSCEGTTDEAFGRANPDGPGEGFTYACAAPTGVTSEAATLRGTTTDPDVTAAEFTFTSPADETRSFDGVAGADGEWSAAVTGLQPDTAYKYQVTFSAGEEEVATAEDCAFATTKAPDTYTCAAPTNVTASGATLRGATSDESIDAATFTLQGANGSTVIPGTETGDSNQWTAEATGLAADTEYTYAVDFTDDGDSHGVGSGDACRFRTRTASVTTVSSPEDDTQVAGVVFTAPTPEALPAAAPAAAAAAPPVAPAPAVAAAPLARTGTSTDVLLPVGLGLVLFGAGMALLGRRQELAIIRRPHGLHYQ